LTALVLATLMSLPVYPLNPTSQDTVTYMNLHVTVGLNGPGSLMSTGPELTAKYEMMIVYPVILRGAFDYRYGAVNSTVYPNGDLHRAMFSMEGMYYRGTKKLTGYVGAGLVWSVYNFSIATADAESLYVSHGFTNVAIEEAFGYRITAGLRLHEVYSLEIGLTDTRPSFLYTQRLDDDRYAVYHRKVRLNDFRISLGYLFHLKI
jgi:hypothetical protein